ncbi:MAG TPA: DUF6076 domain-containing protein [Oscillospiraceae bacterium]|nr:DUF6076 domain-containing protein [Oscillospiraceae bacterium]
MFRSFRDGVLGINNLNTKGMVMKHTEELSKFSSMRFKLHQGQYWLSNFPVVSSVRVGDFLIDFISTNFDSEESFYNFATKWGISAFYDFSKTAKRLIDDLDKKIVYKDEEIHPLLHETRLEIMPLMERIQEYFKLSIEYCLEVTNEKDDGIWQEFSIHQRYFLVMENADKARDKITEKLPEIYSYQDKMQYNFEIISDIDLSSIKLSSTEDECKEAVKISDTRPVLVYKSTNIAALLSVEFQEMIKREICVKRCLNCGLFFIPENRIDTKYCTRTQMTKTGSKATCQQIGATRKYRKKTKENIVYREYRKRYKTNHARLKGGMWTEDRWNVWKDAANKKFNEYKTETSNDKITFFLEWLNTSSTNGWYEENKKED